MMGLIIMEWKKLVQNKLFDFLVFLLLMIGIAYAFLFPWYSYGQIPNLQQMEKAYQYFDGKHDAEQISEEIKNLQEEQYIYSTLDMLSALPLNQAQVYYDVYFSKYGPDISSPYSLTVAQLLVLVSLLKISCSIVSFLVCALICTCCSKNVSFAFLTGIIAVSIGCDYLISEASVFQMLKYLNLSSFFRGTRLFGNYIHIHVGSWMIPYSLVLPSMILTISMISIILTVIIWSIPIGKTQHPFLRQYLLYIPDKVMKVLATKRKKANGLFFLESYKLIYTQKAYTILALTCIVQFFIYQGFTISMDRTEYSFQQRLQSLSGEFSEEKYQRIADEYNQLNQIQEQIDAYTNGSVSDSSETIRLSDLDYYHTLLRSKETVDRLMMRSDMLKERTDNGDAAYYVLDTGYLLLCGIQKQGIRYQPLMISILLTLLLSGIFAIEYECGTESLLRTLPDGEEKLFHMKLRLCLLVFLVVFLLSWVPEIIYIIKNCTIKYLWIPAANIPVFQSFPEFITIGMMIMLVLVVRLLFALTNMGIILLIARKSHSTIAALFFNSIISAGIGVLVMYGS